MHISKKEEEITTRTDHAEHSLAHCFDIVSVVRLCVALVSCIVEYYSKLVSQSFIFDEASFHFDVFQQTITQMTS